MKRIVAAILIVCILAALLAGCTVVPKETTPQETHPSEHPTTPTEPTLPEYVPGSVTLLPRESLDEGPVDRQYRACYYIIHGEYLDMIHKYQHEVQDDWFHQFGVETDYGNNQHEMYLAAAIKHYNIPREEFDIATQKFIESRNSTVGIIYPDDEWMEVPNGDIIYTFDNEIINRYYRYE